MNTQQNTAKVHGAVAYIPRILAALREMDGVAKAAAVKDAIVTNMAERGEPLDESLLQSGAPKYINQIEWARLYLVNAGFLAPKDIAGHGIWKLTDQGWTVRLGPDTALQIYQQSLKKGKQEDDDSARAPDEEGQVELLQSWETQLTRILTSLPDKGFERLCAEIMARNDLHSTKVTGKTGDGGIDGEGLMALDPLRLVSVRVAWQCKRFKDGTVGSSEIRDFRGALDSATNHGIVFTTSTFTQGAIQESSMPGKKPIKLINLSDLIDMLCRLKLGVGPASSAVPDNHDMVVDEAFFRPFQNPAGDAGAASLWGDKTAFNQPSVAG